MTRNDIEQAVYRRTGKVTSSPDSAVQTRVRHFVNRRYRKIMATPGMPGLFDDTTTFASVASQSRYALPNIERILRLREATSDRVLLPMSMSEYRMLSPDQSTVTGTPSHFVVSGYEPVAKQPADASQLFVKSSDAADTTQTAYAEVDISGELPRTISVTLTGTTAVSMSAAVTTALRVRKFYLSATGAGNVTLHEDSGAGTELAKIGIGQTAQRYWVFYLYPQPTAVVTYDADVQIPVTDLAQNTDEPRLPEKFHDLLELGAAMDELGKTDDARYRIMQEEYADLMNDLQYWIAAQRTSAQLPVERSQLGAWFPAGS